MTRANGFHLYLVRHGESANNALPEHQRVADPALTKLGEKQVRALGQHYSDFDRIDQVVASPFRRTLQTAQPLLAMRGMKADIWPDMYEAGGCYTGYEEGRLSGAPGMTNTEISSEFAEFNIPEEIDHNGWYKCRPCETWEMAITRSASQAQKLRDCFENRDIVVFCFIHADFKQLLLRQLAPDQDQYHHGLISNSSVTHLHFSNGGGSVIDYCNIDHLEPGDASV